MTLSDLLHLIENTFDQKRIYANLNSYPKPNFNSNPQGRQYGGDWGEQSPQLLTKVIFVNRLEPMRKNWGYGGGVDVNNYIWISAWVCHKWFSKTGSNLYFIQFIFSLRFLHFIQCDESNLYLIHILSNLFFINTDVLNLFIVFWNSCAMPRVLCIIKL